MPELSGVSKFTHTFGHPVDISCIDAIQIAVPNEECVPFNYDLQRQHVVFCGTEILQGKTQGGDFCKAVVIRTGDLSTLGPLILFFYSITLYKVTRQADYLFLLTLN